MADEQLSLYGNWQQNCQGLAPTQSATTTTGTGLLGQQWLGSPIPIHNSWPSVSHPIFQHDSDAGIFIVNSEGKQRYVPIADIVKYIGMEW